jgi:hypothetical protein
MASCPRCALTVDHGVPQCPRCGANLVVSSAYRLDSGSGNEDQPVMFPMAPPPPDPRWTPGQPVLPATPIRVLGTALCGLLVTTAAALLSWTVVPGAEAPALVMSLVTGIVTIIWLYRARTNVEGMRYQRRKKGWAIGGWFCPVVNLWFPLQIVEDVARADNPPDRPNAGAPIRYAWWACWLLTWVSGFYYRQVHTVYPNGGENVSYSIGSNFGGTVLSRVFAAAAALLLAAIVREISLRQERRSSGLGV